MENDDEDKYTSVSDDPLSNLILEVIKNDNLRKMERAKRQESEHCILTAAKLISPVSKKKIIKKFTSKQRTEIQ
jgi:hypothetical protein